jgi:hypothetical protein
MEAAILTASEGGFQPPVGAGAAGLRPRRFNPDDFAKP